MFVAYFFIWLGAMQNMVAAILSVYGDFEGSLVVRLQRQTGWIFIATGAGILTFNYS